MEGQYMIYNIRGSKVEITEGIKSYAEEKLKKLEKYFSNHHEITANVVCRVRGRSQLVEVTIPTKNYTLRAEENHEDLYAALDLVIDKLERQIRKNKTKMNPKIVKDINLDFNYDKDEDIEEQTIIRRKKIETKPMSEEEAILQMNLLGHDFFIFKDSETNETAVIYKRKDGNYGLIETK